MKGLETTERLVNNASRLMLLAVEAPKNVELEEYTREQRGAALESLSELEIQLSSAKIQLERVRYDLTRSNTRREIYVNAEDMKTSMAAAKELLG